MDDGMKEKQSADECYALPKDCCVEEVGEIIQRLVRVMQLFERDQIKPFGFTTSQCYSLIELQKSKELTMNELSDKMNLNSSTMTRIINNLVRDGFVERAKKEADRRIVVVRLTAKGLEASMQLQGSIMDFYRKIVANLPYGQIENVLRSVSLVIDAFDNANPNCC